MQKTYSDKQLQARLKQNRKLAEAHLNQSS